MMTDKTDDFFIPDNEVRLPDELDYSRVNEYVRSAEAFSRSSYQSVYKLGENIFVLIHNSLIQTAKVISNRCASKSLITD